MNIDIKYFSKDYPKLEKIEDGDWIDLRVDNIKNYSYTTGYEMENSTVKAIDTLFSIDEELTYEKGDVIKFGLGVAMKLPKGYEAIVVPRSSTFKHWGLMQTNSIGIIDNSYCGDEDEWQIEFLATRDGVIRRFDRVCQFRILKNQPSLAFNETDELDDINRGGFGSTGRA